MFVLVNECVTLLFSGAKTLLMTHECRAALFRIASGQAIRRLYRVDFCSFSAFGIFRRAVLIASVFQALASQGDSTPED